MQHCYGDIMIFLGDAGLDKIVFCIHVMLLGFDAISKNLHSNMALVMPKFTISCCEGHDFIFHKVLRDYHFLSRSVDRAKWCSIFSAAQTLKYGHQFPSKWPFFMHFHIH